MRSSDKHYNDLGGIDSRTNPITQNPKFARGGTNFAYSYRDELMKRRGFQHKVPGNGCEAGLMEYKFTDINTGESQTQILGIGSDGNLNRLKKHYFRINISGGSVASYSLYYRTTGTPNWVIQFFDSSGTSLGEVTFVQGSTTISDLSTAVNSLSITGLATSVVDEDGGAVTSSVLAYTMDTVINKALPSGITTNEGWFWEQVPKPSSEPAFPSVVSQATNPNYEGPTWVNANNSIYITDGGFPMKYDGFSVYRAGMPRTFLRTNVNQSSDGFAVSPAITSGAGMDLGIYRYKMQLGFVDPNGVEILGKLDDNYIWAELTGSQNSVVITVPPLCRHESTTSPTRSMFPCYGAKVNGNQDLTSSSLTFNVFSGHNILPGMHIQFPILNSPLGGAGISFLVAKVESVTATSITLASFPLANAPYYPFGSTATTVNTNQWLQAGYCPDSLGGTITDPVFTAGLNIIPQPQLGAFVRVWRTRVNSFDTYYKLVDIPLHPYDGSSSPNDKYNFTDEWSDSIGTEHLSSVSLTDNEGLGEEIPRACRYLSEWQDTIIQSGRPYNESLANAYYPSNYTGIITTIWGVQSLASKRAAFYTEANLCDFQSVYWASQDAPEGFPQDGLHEFLISTKFNDEIRGMIGNKDSFFVFKERSTGYLTGTLADNNLALEILEADVGSVCHKVLQEVQGSIFFMDNVGGFWSVVAGRLPVFIGYGIEDEFRENPRGLNFRKAIAANFRFDDKYVCHIPGDSPVFFAFDYASKPAGGSRSAWLIWNGVNANSGVLATANDELLLASGTADMVWKQKFTKTKYDFSDHLSAINFNYVGPWINFGFPTIDKSFLKIWINSIQGDFSLDVNQYMNYLETLVASKAISFPAASNKLTVKEYANLKPDKVSAMSIGFQNNVIYDDVKIQGWEIEYSAAFNTNEGRA